jgi:hypothetical protein
MTGEKIRSEAIFALLLMLAAPNVTAAEPVRLSGPNCGIEEYPPAEADRTPVHGNEFVVYPRAPGPSYTGCSWVWFMTGPAVRVQWVSRFDAGKPVFHRTSKQLRGQLLATECTYEGDTLKARMTHPPGFSGEECPATSELIRALTK